MKTKQMIIEGKKIEVKLFKTRQAAENFINKKNGREIIFYRAYEYYVNI